MISYDDFALYRSILSSMVCATIIKSGLLPLLILCFQQHRRTPIMVASPTVCIT